MKLSQQYKSRACTHLTLLTAYCAFILSLSTLPSFKNIYIRSSQPETRLHLSSSDHGGTTSHVRNLLTVEETLKEFVGGKVVKSFVESTIEDYELDKHSRHGAKHSSISLKHSKSSPNMYYVELFAPDQKAHKYYCLGYNQKFLADFEKIRANMSTAAMIDSDMSKILSLKWLPLKEKSSLLSIHSVADEDCIAMDVDGAVSKFMKLALEWTRESAEAKKARQLLSKNLQKVLLTLFPAPTTNHEQLILTAFGKSGFEYIKSKMDVVETGTNHIEDGIKTIESQTSLVKQQIVAIRKSMSQQGDSISNPAAKTSFKQFSEFVDKNMLQVVEKELGNVDKGIQSYRDAIQNSKSVVVNLQKGDVDSAYGALKSTVTMMQVGTQQIVHAANNMQQSTVAAENKLRDNVDKRDFDDASRKALKVAINELESEVSGMLSFDAIGNVNEGVIALQQVVAEEFGKHIEHGKAMTGTAQHSIDHLQNVLSHLQIIVGNAETVINDLGQGSMDSAIENAKKTVGIVLDLATKVHESKF